MARHESALHQQAGQHNSPLATGAMMEISAEPSSTAKSTLPTKLAACGSSQAGWQACAKKESRAGKPGGSGNVTILCTIAQQQKGQVILIEHLRCM